MEHYFLLHYFQLWDIRGSHCIQTFTGHESDINSIVVSTDSINQSIFFNEYVKYIGWRGQLFGMNLKKPNHDTRMYFLSRQL